MAEINLLDSLPKTVRDVAARTRDKERNRRLALKFDFEYFDGPREQGYGGYVYDGRWVPVARRLITHFGLEPGNRVLDVGCAKGFLVKDLRDACLDLEVYGIDISAYALHHSSPECGGFLVRGTADFLPFADGCFDAVLSINTVHNLARPDCIRALAEIERLSGGRAFVQVDAYRNTQEKSIFEDWMLTAKTYCTPEEWIELFRDAGYTGDYYWTILELDPLLTKSAPMISSERATQDDR